MENKILVTGAAGFIGFHVAKNLIGRKERVFGIDNLNDYYDVSLKQARLDHLSTLDGFEFAKVDITDKPAMEKLWTDHGPFKRVVHLAAQAGVRYSLKDPYAYVHSNCMGHLTVMEMCRHTKGFKHLVYASSSSVYGGNTKMPFSVTDEVNTPLSLYAATKRSDELMSQCYSHLYKIPQTGLRFFTVYGPWGRPDMALFIFTQKIAQGVAIEVYNNGDMKRDFTFIDDIVQGVVSTLDHPPEDPTPHRILNIGNTRSENLMDFIKIIEQELGKKAIIEFKPIQPGDVTETYADIQEIKTLTGFEPKTTIQQGIPRFIAWYKNFYKL